MKRRTALNVARKAKRVSKHKAKVSRYAEKRKQQFGTIECHGAVFDQRGNVLSPAKD